MMERRVRSVSVSILPSSFSLLVSFDPTTSESSKPNVLLQSTQVSTRFNWPINAEGAKDFKNAN